MTADDMTIQISFANPESISAAGISSDSIKLTFWSSELLQAENGLALEEGQTIAKGIIPQVEPGIGKQISELGRTIGILVLVIIAIGLAITLVMGFDQTPFWLFFNCWQLFLHVPLLNLKIPGFVNSFWREQLMIWTMRNANVNQWMCHLSHGLEEDKKSYTLQLEAAKFDSLHIYVNLGLILWVPAIIIALMPVAWIVDTFCTLRDSQREQFGGRKPLTKQPLLCRLTNLLSRFALMATLDIMICVFICLSTAWHGAYVGIQRDINLGIGIGLLALFVCFVLFTAGYGVWRFVQARKAEEWKDYLVSSYVSTLFEGANLQHPERMTFFQLVTIFRQTAFAATIVFLYEDPVFQLYALLGTSIVYNCVLAWQNPYYELYNRLLNMFNELSFFFFVAMNMTFTDFVTDIPTRQETASLLSNYMFFVLAINVLVCCISLILTQRHRCQKKELKQDPELILKRSSMKGRIGV